MMLAFPPHLFADLFLVICFELPITRTFSISLEGSSYRESTVFYFYQLTICSGICSFSARKLPHGYENVPDKPRGMLKHILINKHCVRENHVKIKV